MSLKRPAAGGESREAGFLFIQTILFFWAVFPSHSFTNRALPVTLSDLRSTLCLLRSSLYLQLCDFQRITLHERRNLKALDFLGRKT